MVFKNPDVVDALYEKYDAERAPTYDIILISKSQFISTFIKELRIETIHGNLTNRATALLKDEIKIFINRCYLYLVFSQDEDCLPSLLLML